MDQVSLKDSLIENNGVGLCCDVKITTSHLGDSMWSVDLAATMVNICEWRHSGYSLDWSPSDDPPPPDAYPIKFYIDYECDMCSRSLEIVSQSINRADIGDKKKLYVYIVENEAVSKKAEVPLA